MSSSSATSVAAPFSGAELSRGFRGREEGKPVIIRRDLQRGLREGYSNEPSGPSSRKHHTQSGTNAQGKALEVPLGSREAPATSSAAELEARARNKVHARDRTDGSPPAIRS